MRRSLETLTDCFVQIDVPGPGGHGHFAFFLPSEEACRRWPHYPPAARPEAGRAAGGRGLTPADCRASGIGEAVEIASCCAWPDDTLAVATISEVDRPALLPDALHGFSPSQVRDRVALNTAWKGADWCPPPAPASAELAWCKARHAMTGEQWFVPADHVLIGRREVGDPDAVAVATTSGCAAGPTIEDARLSALLELVERDAIGRWWYGARRRARVDPAAFALPGPLLRYLRTRDRRTLVFDISTELWSPVLAAVSWEGDGSKIALGFSARPDPAGAGRHAVIEMLQTELGIEQRLARNEPDIREWCRDVSAGNLPLDPETDVVSTSTFEANGQAMERLLGSFAREGIPVLFVDRTRPEFDIPVVRAIAPGLCTDKPRWGSPRLLAPDTRDLSSIADRRGGEPPNPIPLRV